VLGAGCSGGSDAESSGTTQPPFVPAFELPDPCALVPVGELNDLVGKKVGKARTEVVSGKRMCTYPKVVNLAVADVESFEAAVEDVRNARGIGVVDVDDVGAEAVWQDLGSAGQLLARNDRYYVGVTVVAGGRAVAGAIAQAMLAAL
jgi:hypothetical protein